MTSSERAQRVAELVEAACECAAEERPGFLREACRDDETALRREVESLLAYDQQAANFIEQPAYQASADFFAGAEGEPGELKPGEQLGDYKIISLLGSGGMGEVYLAEDSGLGRKVALKLVKRGFGTSDFIRHFQREERILARLDHPYIARLYGAAVTERGLPYFVMEHVAGVRLDQYCDERRLSLTERLVLFQQVCSGVAFAHQRLVIHRDLKPANILVTADGSPKLLDFGIAKLLDAEEASDFAPTMTLAGVMTPDYASPEQVRGEPMTTASDVYSLGVILYELLTGAKPYRTANRRPDEISRAVTEQNPSRPSTARLHDSRFTNHDSRFLKGDLDNIILMALRKEPERRYASVGQFSEDIRRHRASLPVIARKDSWNYRATKFIGRNKTGVIAATLLFVALLGGIAATSWQARVAQRERARADRRFQDVRELANSFLFEFHDAIERLPGSTPARALVVRRGLEYLDSLAAEAEGDPTLQREVALAYVRLGNVQGNPRNANLGDSAGAMESYRKALAIAGKLAAANPESVLRRPLAIVWEKIADVQAETNQIAEAVRSARTSLAIFHEIAEAEPHDPAARISLAISHLKVGDISGNPNFANAGDQTNAMENYRAATQIFQALHTADPAEARVRRFLGLLHERLGTMSELRGDRDSALAAYEASARIRVALAAEFPNDTTLARDAAIAHEKLGNAAEASGEWEKALEHRRTSLEMFRQLRRADPQNTLAQHSLAISHIHLADLLSGANLNQPAEAAENYRQATQLLEAVIHADAANAAAREDLAEAQAKMEKVVPPEAR